jgi:hypothetical protein
VVRRADHGDGREHRPGTGHEQQPEPESEHEPVAVRVDRAPRQPREGVLQQLAEAGPHQAETDDEQHRDAGVSQQIPRQVQRAEQQ